MSLNIKDSPQGIQKKKEWDVEVKKKKWLFIVVVIPTTIKVILTCPCEIMIDVLRFLR
jgi:hypothetical protein